MIKVTYYCAVKSMKNIYDIRKKLVLHAIEYGISSASREFTVTRKTVRKWFTRYKLDGLKGLTERSRAPNNPHNKMSEQEERRIIEIRKKQPYLGPVRIKYEHGINRSPSAIARVLRQAGLTSKRKKKYKVKRDLREVKRRLKAFEKVQVDVKELKDIPKYYPYLIKGYPKYQFTARDVRTGICYISYANEKSSTNAALFLEYLCKHLKRSGIELNNTVIQTDNGGEFIGTARRNSGKSMFEKTAESYRVTTEQIPPRRCTYNSDVEASHRLIEDEFYDMETYRSKLNLLCKAYTYMLYFNFKRKFRYKGMKTPVEILKEIKYNNINFNRVAKLKPVILDNYLPSSYNKGGYHVPGPDIVFEY